MARIRSFAWLSAALAVVWSWRRFSTSTLCSAALHALLLFILAVMQLAAHAPQSTAQLLAQLSDSPLELQNELAGELSPLPAIIAERAPSDAANPPNLAPAQLALPQPANPQLAAALLPDLSDRLPGLQLPTRSSTSGHGESDNSKVVGKGDTTANGAANGSHASSKRTATSGLSGFFGLKAPGKRFVFVVDVSGSMNGHRFRRARAELRRAIEALTADEEYYVVFFNDGALPMPAEALVPATKANLSKTVRWFHRVRCGGETNPLSALLVALDMQPDAIYLLTDGEFDADVVPEFVQAQASSPVPVFTIGFADRSGEKLLQDLATQTGGTYRFVP